MLVVTVLCWWSLCCVDGHTVLVVTVGGHCFGSLFWWSLFWWSLFWWSLFWWSVLVAGLKKNHDLFLKNQINRIYLI